MRKPKGITKKGFKQSMGLHGEGVTEAAYNTFKVNDSPAFPSFIDCLFQDRSRNTARLG